MKTRKDVNIQVRLIFGAQVSSSLSQYLGSGILPTHEFTQVVDDNTTLPKPQWHATFQSGWMEYNVSQILKASANHHSCHNYIRLPLQKLKTTDLEVHSLEITRFRFLSQNKKVGFVHSRVHRFMWWGKQFSRDACFTNPVISYCSSWRWFPQHHRGPRSCTHRIPASVSV